jgi:Domain of unknown function (DUF6458)
MRTAPGLALIAIGAILAFAVTSSPSFLNLQIAGWVIMLTGVAGIVVPRRGYGWMRRQVVVRRPRGVAMEPRGGRRALGGGQMFHRNPGPGDFTGLAELLTLVPVTRPSVPRER